jgi:uncharacterized protein YceH (UPF0502 family)
MTTTKYRCNGCGIHSTCKVENADFMGAPEQCLYRSAREEHVCWKRDCTEEKKPDMEEIETRIEKYKRAKLDALFGTMGRQLKEQECKIQELITAGQGQMARIQALEKEVARSTDSYLQKQIDALDKKIDDLEGKYRAHSHIYGTHQWDQYTSQPRYMG